MTKRKACSELYVRLYSKEEEKDVQQVRVIETEGLEV